MTLCSRKMVTKICKLCN